MCVLHSGRCCWPHHSPQNQGPEKVSDLREHAQHVTEGNQTQGQLSSSPALSAAKPGWSSASAQVCGGLAAPRWRCRGGLATLLLENKGNLQTAQNSSPSQQNRLTGPKQATEVTHRHQADHQALLPPSAPAPDPAQTGTEAALGALPLASSFPSVLPARGPSIPPRASRQFCFTSNTRVS